MQLQDYVNDVQEILHDVTASSWPVSRVVSRINEARLDVARDMHCIRQNVVGVQLIPGTEIYNLKGAVAGATVLASGSNYGAGPTVPVTFSPAPAGGVTALAFGNLVNGSLAPTQNNVPAIQMTRWGVGYTSPPTITIGGVGSGAVATPVVLFQSNPLSSIIGNPLAITKISYLWNFQRRQMQYMNFTLFDAYPRMWASIAFNAPPGVWSHHQQQQLVYIQPPPDQLYAAEWDIVFMPSPLVAMTDLDTQIVDPWARALQFRAAENLLMKHRNWGEVNALGAKYDAFVPHIITTSGGIRIPNIYNRNFQRRVMR